MRVVMLKRPGKHCNYFRDQDLETTINLSPAVMRSCHRAEGSTQGDLIARALCALNIWSGVCRWCPQQSSTRSPMMRWHRLHCRNQEMVRYFEYPESRFWLLPKRQEVQDYREAG